MKRTLVVGVAVVALFGAAACGSSGGAPPPRTSAAMPDLVGSGRARDVPAGPGPVAGVAADPVVIAARNNPLLTTLVSAMSGKLDPNVSLLDTHSGNEFTGCARVDEAFAKR